MDWKGTFTMRLDVRDVLATGLVAAIAVPYTGYLVLGDMPLVHGARQMAAVGIALGLVAFIYARGEDSLDRLGVVEVALAVVSLATGFATLLLDAETMLAIFMASILVVWLLEMLDHLGVLTSAEDQTTLTQRPRGR